MITFSNGISITNTEAAALIRREGKLTRLSYCNKRGGRCFSGVIEGWYLQNGRAQFKRRMVDVGYGIGPNDRFRGTNVERAEHMAQWIEAQ